MIFKIENNSLDNLIDKINKLEDDGEAILLGAISNYSKEGSIEVNFWDKEKQILKPVNIFYATMRDTDKEDF